MVAFETYPLKHIFCQEYIARRARRKMAKKMAQSKSSQAENNMTANDHTSAERAGPGIAQTVSKVWVLVVPSASYSHHFCLAQQVATVQDTHNVKIVQVVHYFSPLRMAFTNYTHDRSFPLSQRLRALQSWRSI